MEEDGVIDATAEGENGKLEIMANPVLDGETLILDRAHIQGPGAGKSSWREMSDFVRQIGEKFGAIEVIVRGHERTSGARPGHTPREMRVKVRE